MSDTIERAARVIAGDWCDATGGDHEMTATGTYKFCRACGETIRGRAITMKEARGRAQALHEAGMLVSGEPVAWRWRFTPEAYGIEGATAGDWHYREAKPPLPLYEAWRREVQALVPLPTEDRSDG